MDRSSSSLQLPALWLKIHPCEEETTLLPLPFSGGGGGQNSSSSAQGMKRKRLPLDLQSGADCVSDSELELGLSCASSSAPRGRLPTCHPLPPCASRASSASAVTSLDSEVFPLHRRAEHPNDGSEGSDNDTDMQLMLSLTGYSRVPSPEQRQMECLSLLDSIPVVDEGSTSARTGKRGGYMPVLLMGRRFESDEGTDLSGGSSGGGGGGGHTERATKTCKFIGCCKGARGASGLCIAHGGGRRCQKEGCSKGAEGRTAFCKAHGGGRRCDHLGCTKSAEGKTDFCIAHGGGRRCGAATGCTKAARGRSGLCIRHGGGKRCKEEGCTKSAEGFSGLCIAHGGGRRCHREGCNKGAQGSTLLCKAHGGGKRCIIDGCTKGAEGSTPLCKAHGGGKRCLFGNGQCAKSVHGGTDYCVAHGGGKRCAVEGCTKSARGRTSHCVKHGGGKRCQADGCGKSAQGSTDFCKAHGGGKRCTWGQDGSAYDKAFVRERTGSDASPCDKFARGKTGLCAAHTALVQDRRVHGSNHLGGVLASAAVAGIQPPPLPVHPLVTEPPQEVVVTDFLNANNGKHGMQPLSPWTGFSFHRPPIPLYMHVSTPSVPPLHPPLQSEGRVHGGSSIMAFLARETAGSSSQMQPSLGQPLKPHPATVGGGLWLGQPGFSGEAN